MYPSPFLDAITAAAGRLGLRASPVDTQNGRLICVSGEAGSARFGVRPLQQWPFNNALAASIAQDKELSLRLLAEADVAIPTTQVVRFDPQRLVGSRSSQSGFDLQAQLQGMALPLVIKPNSAWSGRGIVFVHSQEILAAAIECAGQHGSTVIAQSMVQGTDVRLYGFENQPLLRIVRQRPVVVADGHSTVTALLATHPPSSEEEALSRQGFCAKHGERIPTSGERLHYHPITNFDYTRRPGALSDRFGPHDECLCQTVYEQLGLRFYAIDLVETAPDQPVVLEVNANPGISMLHRQPDHPLSRSLIDFLVLAAVTPFKTLVYPTDNVRSKP